MRFTMMVVLAGGIVGGGIYVVSRVGEPGSESGDTLFAEGVADNTAATAATNSPIVNSILPDSVYVRPTYRTAKYVETVQKIGHDGDRLFEQNVVTRCEIDYLTPIGSATFDRGDSRTQVISTDEFIYVQGDELGVAPWKRQPRGATAELAMDSIGYLPMYQEVATPEARAAARNVRISDEVVAGVPVTTYRFDAPSTALQHFNGAFGNSDSRAGLDDELLEVHVTLSVSDDGLIRVLDYFLNEQAWTAKLSISKSAAPVSMYVHARIELTSTSIEPSTITPPAEFVVAPMG